MFVNDDLDADGKAIIACCWICNKRSNPFCTGLYHELVDIMDGMYPPGDQYLVHPSDSLKIGSLAISGPIVDSKGRVWNADWLGHPVSFVQSSVVQEADQKRMKADMLDQLRNANLAEEEAMVNRRLTQLMQRRGKRSNTMNAPPEYVCQKIPHIHPCSLPPVGVPPLG